MGEVCREWGWTGVRVAPSVQISDPLTDGSDPTLRQDRGGLGRGVGKPGTVPDPQPLSGDDKS